MTTCFIDTMRPITQAEIDAWCFYIRLPVACWRAAREMFRRSCGGDDLGTNLIQFVSETGITDLALLDKLETVLRDLAEEKR